MFRTLRLYKESLFRNQLEVMEEEVAEEEETLEEPMEEDLVLVEVEEDGDPFLSV